jgi:hypothetical protein
MFHGYLNLGGVEIGNNARTETYARAAGYHGIKTRQADLGIPTAVGDAAYTTAAANNAPWYDPTIPVSAGFHGVYVTSVTGLEDSVATVDVSPNVGDGGAANRLRRGQRTIVVNTLLLGSSEAALAYGQAWLAQVLARPICSTAAGCGGTTLKFLSVGGSNPADLRRAVKTGVTVAPVQTGRRVGSCNTHLAMMTFTLVAGDPGIYGVDRLTVRDFATTSPTSYFAHSDLTVVNTGADYTDSTCTNVDDSPLYDPLRPAVVAPAQAPKVPVNGYNARTVWKRRTIYVPPAWFTEWGEVVPTVSVKSGATENRDVRLRFYPSSNGTISDQCGFVADMLFTYLPVDTRITMSGVTQDIYAQILGGAVRNASSLVLSGNGKPFNLPTLSCGNGYVIAVDTAPGETLPAVDLYLTTRNSIQPAAAA